MIVKLTARDKKQIKRLRSDYAKKIAEVEALIVKLAPTQDYDEEKEREIQSRRPKMPDPVEYDDDGTPIYSQESLRPYRAEMKKINDELDQLFEAWLDSGAPGFREARKERLRLISEQGDAINALFKQIERREFSKLGGDREKIIQSAREQVQLLIDNRFKNYQKMIATHQNEDREPISGFSAFDLRVDGENIYLDQATIIQDCKRSLLALHYEALSHDQEAIKEIDDIVLTIVTDSPKTSSDKGVRGGKISFEDKTPVDFAFTDEERRELEEVKVSYPASYITPIDKVSNKAFEGVLNSTEPIGVEVVKKAKSRKPIYTLVSIDITELEGVKINGRRELTAFDREVHDAIITLFVEGGNTYITVNMIYQMMTGKRGAHCSSKQAQAISDAITKLMFSHAIIDASQEAKLRGLDKAKYDSNLLNAKRLTISANGQTTEAIKILDTPILYDYAERRNQIGRFDVKLLDSPVNKTEENIVLDGYLRRRILSIKGSSKLSPTIKYDTVYKQLEITASSDGALRKKKLKVRETVKKLLDFYKKEGFIKGYVENTHKSEKNKIDSVTVRF